MINKPQTARRHVARYVLLLPLIVAFAFTVTLTVGQTGTPNVVAGTRVSVDSPDAVYYLDGKPADKADLDKINPADIETITVYKGESAAAIPGSADKGLVVLTTKKNKDSAAVRELNEKINKAKGQKE
jgi:outer membrane receptor protein involved in Fe transport